VLFCVFVARLFHEDVIDHTYIAQSSRQLIVNMAPTAASVGREAIITSLNPHDVLLGETCLKFRG
jgi:hypothetical protein